MLFLLTIYNFLPWLLIPCNFVTVNGTVSKCFQNLNFPYASSSFFPRYIKPALLLFFEKAKIQILQLLVLHNFKSNLKFIT